MKLYLKIGTWPGGYYDLVRAPKGLYAWRKWTKRSAPTVGDACVVRDHDGREIPLLIDGQRGDLLIAQQF